MAVPTQTVKGRIIDAQSHQPVPGATVMIVDTKLGSYAKADGTFKIANVPAGRWIIAVTSIGYEPQKQNIVVVSGSELQLNVQLQISYFQTDTIAVTAKSSKFESINESALVSDRAFTPDEAMRYAGSRMDVGRMAQNFAGVSGASDRRNDLIIRGGSPTELLWRIDGLDIPNPNHFATQGATGGPVSAFNTNLIDNSDFLTGAFPADYYNKMSGVFDIHTKKGNDEKYEFMAEMGFNGFELGAQGPLGIMNGSFIANYRYSFLDIMQAMGLELGLSGIPYYQDCMVKLDFSPSDKDQVSVTGIWGTSNIFLKQSDVDTVYTGDFDIKNGTDLLSVGVNWQHLFSAKFYTRLVLGTVYNKYWLEMDSITTNDENDITSIDRWLESSSSESFYTAKVLFNFLPDRKNFISFGFESKIPYYNLYEKRYSVREDDQSAWLLDQYGNSLHISSFVNWNWRLTEDLTSDIGFSSQYLELSNKFTLEPRIAMAWKFDPLQSVSLGFGVNRQSLPLVTYFYADGNENLDFMQSIHYVIGYRYTITHDAEIRVESYYKDISNAAVEISPSSFSFLNTGANFYSIGGQNEPYKSTGVGRTYGAELSIIKNFSSNYYFTSTFSYVRQEYKGSDDIWRLGAFDNIFIFNILGGYEWFISPNFTIEVSGKYTTAGGLPYTPIDYEKSKMYNSTYYLDSEAFSLRNPNFGRMDARIDFRNNFKSFSITSYIQAENLLDQKNVLTRVYNPQSNSETVYYQTGFLFIGGVKVEF